MYGILLQKNPFTLFDFQCTNNSTLYTYLHTYFTYTYNFKFMKCSSNVCIKL